MVLMAAGRKHSEEEMALRSITKRRCFEKHHKEEMVLRSITKKMALRKRHEEEMALRKHTGEEMALGSSQHWHHHPAVCRRHRSTRTGHRSGVSLSASSTDVQTVIHAAHLFLASRFVVVVPLDAVCPSVNTMISIQSNKHTLNSTGSGMAWRVCLQVVGQFSLILLG
ncbi:hypothetical protein E2P81_ATG00739 [Venturia nashicola]|uniref:Uncharacterized protein n=1 Tax=Venturia nashicola TaxID=86259 RepID=A0A4Z1PP66_9PEZI|nr:hypothetical protein E6O75_ATG00756 [Venturia nashicola]TLD39752.1 hypothetical protein E2P81_ATG00739 [Venturia nashicola]